MPSYDYRCQTCRVVFEVERSMSDPANDPTCTTCGSDIVTRIWNAFIRSGSITPDVGQGSSQRKSSGGGGCGSCSSHSCGTCH